MGTLWFAHYLCHFGPNVRMSGLGREGGQTLGQGADFEWVGLWRRSSSMCHVEEMSKTVGPCFAGRVRARSAVRL